MSPTRRWTESLSAALRRKPRSEGVFREGRRSGAGAAQLALTPGDPILFRRSELDEAVDYPQTKNLLTALAVATLGRAVGAYWTCL